MNDISQKIERHAYEIDTLKDSVGKVLDSVNKLTDAMNNQATQFAVYAAKHDTVAVELDSLRKDVNRHSNELAAMKPVVDGVRGLVWKVIGASIMGGTGVAALIAAITKLG